MIKNIFARIWAVWGILVFVITMLIFLIPFFLFCAPLKDPQKTVRFIKFSRVWMWFFLNLTGCPLTIKGRENFRKGENYIVLCNHNSFLDVPVSSPAIPYGNKTIAKAEMAKIPIFSAIYKAGSILVDRKSEASRVESYIRMKNVLEMGLHMCIYPEGTRNRTSAPLKSFHNGAFKLSIETGKSIIPALIFHTKKALPPGKGLYFLPHPLEMHFLPEVAPKPGETMEELNNRVFEIMKDYYVKNS